MGVSTMEPSSDWDMITMADPLVEAPIALKTKRSGPLDSSVALQVARMRHERNVCIPCRLRKTKARKDRISGNDTANTG